MNNVKLEANKIDTTNMNDDLIREYVKLHDDGHVIFQTEEGEKTITVNSSVVEYCLRRKENLENEMKNSANQLLDKAVSIIREFDTKPFDFSSHAMVDRMYEGQEIPMNIKLICMGDERIRIYGLFSIMLNILKGKFPVYQNNVHSLKEMVDWLSRLLWNDFSMTVTERTALDTSLDVLPHSS